MTSSALAGITLTLLLSACGGAENEVRGGLSITKQSIAPELQSPPPLGATGEPAGSTDGDGDGGNVVPPVDELPQEETSSPPASSLQPETSSSLPVISYEEVFKVLDDHGLFYKSDQEYLDTAAALSRDGGFEEWVAGVLKEAQRQYPAAADELEQGKTMAEIMEPWVAIFANKKGISPNIVDWEQTDLLRYIVSLDKWPTVEEFSTMIETEAP